MTPEVFPPTIPKPRPVPSLTSSMVSRCSNCDSQQSAINVCAALAASCATTGGCLPRWR